MKTGGQTENKPAEHTACHNHRGNVSWALSYQSLPHFPHNPLCVVRLPTGPPVVPQCVTVEAETQNIRSPSFLVQKREHVQRNWVPGGKEENGSCCSFCFGHFSCIYFSSHKLKVYVSDVEPAPPDYM